MSNPIRSLFSAPLLRRLAWYGRRVARQIDRRFFASLAVGALAFVVAAAVLITLLEKTWTVASLFDGVNWGIATILGSGDPAFVVSPGGRIVAWVLQLFGVAIIGTITGALVALVIDFLLKEGQGLGASGYRDHIVVCGWNATARDLLGELKGDDYQKKVVVLARGDKNPAGDGVYFVSGDPSEPADLKRAGIEEAAAAVIFPADDSNEADMASILSVMAIKSVAPELRTVAEVNHPRHADHFRRAKADEILVTSTLASHLLARSALYPGLTEIVTDIVSGGEGSELYRITLPDEYLGLTIDEVSAHLRVDHRATLLSINRGGRAFVNPPADFRLSRGDDAVVVAESLGSLAPLELREAHAAGLEPAVATEPATA
ncbi:MAG TPA: NAD-binding protein [Candidatus Limnocylindrales bacterium]